MGSRGSGLWAWLLLVFVGVGVAEAQLPGNTSLQGNYYVRYLGVIGSPCDCPISFLGTITFDGKGGYRVNGQGTYNDGSDHPINGSGGSGKYQVLSSGAVIIDNPVSNGTASLYGGLGSGAIVASSSDSGYLDLFVAIPAAANTSNSTLSGAYQVEALEFTGGSLAASRNAMFATSANGAGGLDIAGATYSVAANGSGSLSFPANNPSISGSKTLYVSADGSFFLAGNGSGYDMVLGVRALPAGGNAALQGLYFTASLQNVADGSAAAGVYASQGASNELGNANGDELVHERITPDGYPSYDQTFADTFRLAAGGTVAYSGSRYAAGAGGNLVVGTGNGGKFQLSLYVKAPALTSGGVYLNPMGVVNAASNTPFTGSISAGEVISLYGSGLSSQTATAPSLPFPATLGGVQLAIAWTDSAGKAQSAPAPLYYVSPGLVSAVVPYTVPAGLLATIQLSNGGAASNAIQVYTAQTSPGIFTVPAGGLGSGAILHADNSLVSAARPAKAGETVQIFLTGLGAVTPAVTAGSAAPSSPPATTVNSVKVYVDGLAAQVPFSGLAPTLGGLYQMNVTIPAGVHSGNVDLEITTVDADNVQATIPIGN